VALIGVMDELNQAARLKDARVMSACTPTLNPVLCKRMEGRPVLRSPEQLRLHPALEELHLTATVEDFNEAVRRGAQSVQEPTLIATCGTVLAGIGRWRLALFEGRPEINCIEYSLTEDEALQFIISHHQSQRGWNAFVCIRLALKLEPYFQQEEKISPDTVAVLDALQRLEARQPGSVAVRVDRHKRTVVLIGQDLFAEPHSQKELKLT